MAKPSASFVSVVSFACLVSLLSPAASLAQGETAVGVRAQGMAGAFTAVADDATATWWNPAGLATGAYFNLILDTGSTEEPSGGGSATGGPTPAWRAGTVGLSIAFPALGLSYYRQRISELQPSPSSAPSAADSTDPSSAIREDQGPVDVRLRSLVVSQVGATVGQSIGDHLVIASTVKLMRGSPASAVTASGDATLDAAAGLSGTNETRGGLDLGAMASFGVLRLGLAVRNVTEPTFGSDADAVRLERHARAGVAVVASSPGAVGAVTVALDADLDRVASATGDERLVAVGTEFWSRSRTLGLRGGVSASTIGGRRTSASVGTSLAVRSGTYVEGELTGGTDPGRHGWSLGFRLTF